MENTLSVYLWGWSAPNDHFQAIDSIIQCNSFLGTVQGDLNPLDRLMLARILTP